MKKTRSWVALTFSCWPCECQWQSELCVPDNYDKWPKLRACVQCCVKWSTKEFSEDNCRSKNISWKCSEYSSQRFEHVFSTWMTLAGDSITMADKDEFLNNIITVSAPKKCSERKQMIRKRWEHWQIYQNMDSRNAAESFKNVGKSMQVYLCVINHFHKLSEASSILMMHLSAFSHTFIDQATQNLCHIDQTTQNLCQRSVTPSQTKTQNLCQSSVTPS
jgi:hypothetical protein